MVEQRPTFRQSKGILQESITGWIGLALFLAVMGYLLYPLVFHDRSRIERSTKELFQLRMIGIAITTYATDNNGELPPHVSLLHQPDAEYLLTEEAKHIFTSPFDENRELRWAAADEPVPTDWYQHGSYHFYPLSGLKIDDITDASAFILAYGPAQGTTANHAAIFLDGSFRPLAEPELQDLISRQTELIQHD